MIFVTSNREKYLEASDFLKGHNIELERYALQRFPQRDDLREDAYGKAAAAFSNERGGIIMAESNRGGQSVVCVIASNGQPSFFYTDEPSASRKNFSTYILQNCIVGLKNLSCRADASLLRSFKEEGSVSLRYDPLPWIEGNPLIGLLSERNPLYPRLLNFILNERGIFLKVWSLQCEKNYWNSSLNGGLPVIKKRDALHEGTFMLHDIFHFLFFDPLVYGGEDEREIRAYIAYRMMSEAWTMVLTDMMAVAHAGLEERGYDVGRRRIYPLFKSLRLDPDNFMDVAKVLFANSVYSLYGDSSEYESLGADRATLESFKDKYGVYFSVDLQWNDGNIRAMMSPQRIGYDRRAYFEALPEQLKRFSTRELARVIGNGHDDDLSFEKLFLLFVGQYEIMKNYQDSFSRLRHAKLAATKYLGGQMVLGFKFPQHPDSQKLTRKLQEAIRVINAARDIDSLLVTYKEAVAGVSSCVNDLMRRGLILPHENVLYRLHVPHFPPQYASYDLGKDSYEVLSDVSRRIMGSTLRRKNATRNIASLLEAEYIPWF